MHHLLIALTLIAALGGCGNKNEPLLSRALSESAAPAESASAGNANSDDNPGRYLAYEHSILIEVEEKRVTEVHQQALAACAAAVAEQCVVLDSRLSTGNATYTQIKLRAKSAGIKQLMASLSTQGKVSSQSFTAEDLAGPIEDSAKKLAMLSDYRSKLEVLRNKASGDIDAMISVNKELAQTQAQIEAISGERAHNLLRVNTEILNISISADDRLSPWRPVKTALSDFGENLASGISGAITAIAYLIPWSIVFLFFVWAGRKLWRRFRKPAPNNPA